jgi:hypothetical protein
MRKSTFALVIALMVAVAWLGVQGNQPRAADDIKQSGPKWEYRVEELNFSDRGGTKSLLNELGNGGWELTTVNTNIGGQSNWIAYSIFKRTKQ